MHRNRDHPSHEVQVVGEILHRNRAGASLRSIARHLDAQGIENKRGGRWYAPTVCYLIERQVT
jgi:Recombinase